MSKLTDALTQFSRTGAREIYDLVARFDSWKNDVTGFGTSRDKTTYTQYGGYTLLDTQQLSWLYHGDDICARAVDTIPDEMLREGFSVDVGDPNLNTVIKDTFEALDVRGKYADGERWGRLYGGGAVIVGADDGRPASTPLVPELADSVNYLYVADRRYLFPITWYREAGNPKLGQPETYLVVPSAGFVAGYPNTIIHESRLILFGGAKTGALEKQMNMGWDHSVLQRVHEIIASMATGFRAVEVMLADGNQAVFKMQGLASLLGADGTEALRARIAAMDLYRSAVRAIVVDAGDSDTGFGAESFERQSVSFEQIPATLDRFMLRVSAALRIPVTILMGQSPAGMNATGESDFRWFYDRIRSDQTIHLAPKIQRLARIVLATKAVAQRKAIGSVDVKFPPLWTETASVQATRQLAIAQRDSLYIVNQVFTPQEVALTRGSPDGFDKEVALSDEAKDARDVAQEHELDDMQTEAPPPTPPAAPGTPPQFGAPNPDAIEQRADAADGVLEEMAAHPRTVILGGPRTGKSTTAARAGERYKRTVRGTDSNIERQSWSQRSETIADWMDEPTDWVIEGTDAARGLRKWLKRNPGKKPDCTVVHFATPMVARSEGQVTQAKGVRTIWNEIRGELEKRGVTIIERDS